MKNSLIAFKKKLLKTNILPVIAIGFIAFLILWAVIAIAIPLLKGNGLNNYTGIEKTLAERILAYDEATRYAREDHMLKPLVQVHVDDVRPTKADEVTAFCPKAEYISNDPNDPRHYTVEWSTRILGSFTAKTFINHGCTPHDNDPVGDNPLRTPYGQ